MRLPLRCLSWPSFLHYFLPLQITRAAKKSFSIFFLPWAVLPVQHYIFLPVKKIYSSEIAAPEDRDRVSAKGFTYGYIGSVILQMICFVLVFFPGVVGGSKDSGTIQYQVGFLLVGIWWWGFGQFALSRLPKSVAAGDGQVNRGLVSKGYRELSKVWKELK